MRFSETFNTDFRPVMPDEKPSGVQSNSNRPAPYPYPTTAKYLQRPHGSYQYNDKHGQRRNHQGLLCEDTSTPFNLVACEEFQSDEKLRFLACDSIYCSIIIRLVHNMLSLARPSVRLAHGWVDLSKTVEVRLRNFHHMVAPSL